MVQDDYYILKGRRPVRVPFDAWAHWCRTADKRIRLNKLSAVTVSTVFLGMNHQFGDGPPILFETMIFQGRFDGYMWRYCSYAEAVAGHCRAVKLVRFVYRLQNRKRFSQNP